MRDASGLLTFDARSSFIEGTLKKIKSQAFVDAPLTGAFTGAFGCRGIVLGARGFRFSD
jgi:hypothetical protein